MDSTHRILFLAPYKELADSVIDAISGLPFQIDVEVANLPHALEVAKSAEKQGYEVIISRGGTALKIKDVVEIPVIELKVTGFDVSRAICEARRYSNHIAVIGSSNIAYGSSQLASMLNIKILEIPIHRYEEYSQGFGTIRSMGIDTIVGDVIAANMAKEHGLRALLIQSESRESILNTILEAKEITEIRRKERARMKQLEVILQFAHGGITAVDEKGRITLFNSEAESLIGIKKDEVLGKNIKEVLSEISVDDIITKKQSQLNELHKIGNSYAVCHKVPIIVDNRCYGAVITIQMLEYIQKIEMKARKELAAKGHIAKVTFDDIIGESRAIRTVTARAKNFAKVDSTILITGDTGCGKELLAQSIHNESMRVEGPFVAVNCAALPENLLESELFGYVGGAFTGAHPKGKTGLFEQAHGGTLFLDEIGEIPLTVQARLLRAIQEGQIQKVGDDKVISIDVRIIAATNQDLNEMVGAGKFRADLYFRINVLNLRLPGLKERPGDIPLLAKFFIRKFSNKYKKPITKIDNKVFELLSIYSWPGNIRELQNVMERLIVEKQNTIIEIEDIEVLMDDVENRKSAIETKDLSQLTQDVIMDVLNTCGNNKSKAAKMLGIDRTTLWRKIKKYAIEDI